MDTFEKATRQKLRFATNKGNISTEDLWDLPLVPLDAIAQSLHKQVNEGSSVSFIDAPNTSQEFRLNKLKFEVVKRVIEVRLADKERAEKAAATKAQKQRIMELIDKKKDEGLAEKSVEELQAMLAD